MGLCGKPVSTMESGPAKGKTLRYQPLKDTEIRLIKMLGNAASTSRENMVNVLRRLVTPAGVSPYTGELQNEAETSPHPSTVLQLQTHNLKNCPPFIALSYVWGDPLATAAIRIDGKCVDVGVNLRDALARIYDVSSTLQAGISTSTKTLSTGQVELFLWVDAVCINQADMAERSRQVPRMREIYRSAYSVLVWLGDFEKLQRGELDVDVPAHSLLLDAMGVEELDGFPKLVNEWDASVLGDVAFDELNHAYLNLMASPWFRRVWVLQEYALSCRRPIALIGSYLLPLRVLEDWPATMRERTRALDTSPKEISSRLDRLHVIEAGKRSNWPSAAIRYLIRATEFRSKSTAHQLVRLVAKMGGQRATVPHDYIYGLLGLVDSWTLPSHLAPDYTLPHARVFADYARFLIRRTGDLRLLMDRASHPDCLEGTPSWVPNFGTYSADLESEPEPQTRHVGGFVTDSRILVAQGTKVAEVLHHHAPERDEDGRFIASNMEQSLREFHDKILAVSAKMRSEPVSHVAWKWLEGLFQQQLNTVVTVMPTVSEENRSVDDFVRRAFARAFSTVHVDNREDLALYIPIIFSSFNYSLLSDGTVAVLHHCRYELIQPGPQTTVWALKGSTRLFVLSTQDGGKTYRYVGWLHMKVELDEEFFLGKTVNEVSLV